MHTPLFSLIFLAAAAIPALVGAYNVGPPASHRASRREVLLVVSSQALLVTGTTSLPAKADGEISDTERRARKEVEKSKSDPASKKAKEAC